MFEKIGVLQYPYNGGVELAAIVLSVLPQRLNIDKSYVIEKKVIGDGETPEVLAWRWYKRPDLHWVLMYINSVRDPLTEWPIAEANLKVYADEKWGVDSASTIHHFTDLLTGDELQDFQAAEIVAAGTPYPANLHPVSVFEYEQAENNKRREILAIAPRYIHEFVSLYEDMIRGVR